jgi:hypothetical protein
MILEYYKVDPNYKKERTFDCPHNAGVICEVKQCNRCGWHPTVAKIRLERIIKGTVKANERNTG